MSCQNIIHTLYANAMTNNLSMAGKEAWDKSIKEASNLVIFSPDETFKAEQTNNEIQWKSKDEYLQFMQKLKLVASGKVRS